MTNVSLATNPKENLVIPPMSDDEISRLIAAYQRSEPKSKK